MEFCKVLYILFLWSGTPGTLRWCSACTSVPEGVFLMYLWREMYSTSTYSSSVLLSWTIFENWSEQFSKSLIAVYLGKIRLKVVVWKDILIWRELKQGAGTWILSDPFETLAFSFSFRLPFFLCYIIFYVFSTDLCIRTIQNNPGIIVLSSYFLEALPFEALFDI